MNFRDSAFITLGLVISLAAHAKGSEEIEFTYAEGTTTLTFDPGKISRKKIESYLEVAPMNEGQFWAPGCWFSLDVKYDEYSNLCREVIQTLKSRRKDLRALSKVRALEPVFRYVSKRADFAIAKAEAALKFNDTKNANVLKQGISGISPVDSCPDEIKKIESAVDPKIKLSFVQSEYSVCLRRKLGSITGHYPLAAWLKFLKSLPLTVKYVEPTEDRD